MKFRYSPEYLKLFREERSMVGYRRAAIKGLSYYIPAEKLTNAQLAREFQDWGVEKIYEKTGISLRGVAGPDECASDLGVAAAKKLFETVVCNREEIQFLLFCTQSPDYFLPATACIVQNRLGLKTSCGALDFNLGCSGFVYGLALAKSLIESGIVENVLLITAETYTKFINPRDKSVRTLFGDGAAATFITAIEAEEEAIGPFVFGTDGRGAKKLIVPAGGLRLPWSPGIAMKKDDGAGNFRSAQDLFMDGPAILNFTLKAVPKVLKQLLEVSSMTLEEMDYFVFHQASRFMLERLRDKIKIPREKFCINMESYGNTVSATIPMALEIELQEGKIKNGDKVVIIGFGVGYSWAAAIIRFL